ncbi:hypothetical protein K456DRAFT_522235 [Colletotrichum gloeosporioides 23]|nr:hypothetical protein K456DRAFT_522235 [Colletotrichum gloeosporioides 23]
MLAEATHTGRGGPKCPQFQVACCRLTCSSVKFQMLRRFSLLLSFSFLPFTLETGIKGIWREKRAPQRAHTLGQLLVSHD